MRSCRRNPEEPCEHSCIIMTMRRHDYPAFLQGPPASPTIRVHTSPERSQSFTTPNAAAANKLHPLTSIQNHRDWRGKHCSENIWSAQNICFHLLFQPAAASFLLQPDAGVTEELWSFTQNNIRVKVPKHENRIKVPKTKVLIMQNISSLFKYFIRTEFFLIQNQNYILN